MYKSERQINNTNILLLFLQWIEVCVKSKCNKKGIARHCFISFNKIETVGRK